MQTIMELQNQLRTAKKQIPQILNAKYPTGMVIDLRSPEGNIYCLLGICNNLMQQLNLDATEKNQFKAELVGKDYLGHLQVMEKWFGMVFVNKPRNEE